MRKLTILIISIMALSLVIAGGLTITSIAFEKEKAQVLKDLGYDGMTISQTICGEDYCTFKIYNENKSISFMFAKAYLAEAEIETTRDKYIQTYLNHIAKESSKTSEVKLGEETLEITEK